MEKKYLSAGFEPMSKTPKKNYYKVLIQKTYSNSDGYVYVNPKNAEKEMLNADKKFTMVYRFKKIPNIHNPMFIAESITGDEFKGRSKIIKHFEDHHAISYAVIYDLRGREFGEA